MYAIESTLPTITLKAFTPTPTITLNPFMNSIWSDIVEKEEEEERKEKENLNMSNFTRANLSAFFKGYYSGLLLDSFQDLAECIADAHHKEKEKFIAFLRHIDNSDFTNDFYWMFEEYRAEAGLPYYDEALHVEDIIKCIRS